MKITVTIDDQLYKRAFGNSQLQPSELISRALEVYLQTEAAKQLSALGGTVPEMRNIPRRR